MLLKDFFNGSGIPQEEYITTENYLSICSYIYWPDTPQNVIEDFKLCVQSPNIRGGVPEENAIVMCPVGLMENLFKCCEKFPNNKFIIIKSPVRDHRAVSKKIMDKVPDNVVKIFSKNVKFKHAKLSPIPIGRDFRNRNEYESFKCVGNKFNNRMLYSNFALNTNENRPKIFNLFKEKVWTTSIAVGEWRKYPITRKRFLEQLYNHKFCLSPNGRGIDSFRTWEAFYLKTIPIVERHICMEPFRKLPILFTDDYTEVTKKYLNERHREMLNTEYDIEKLYFSVWKEKILNIFKMA